MSWCRDIVSAEFMKKYLTTLSSFVIMLCLGGVYAWSITAAELIGRYGFSTTQTQLIFGTVIAVFPVTMIFAGRLAGKVKARGLGYISALLFLTGYLLAGISGGNFYIIFIGVGILAGIGTGFGYLVSITVPVMWFPKKKGLITGIAAAGFGLGAILMSSLAEWVLQSGRDIFSFFMIVGLSYGFLIFLFSNFVFQPADLISSKKFIKTSFLSSKAFRKLFVGIFLGTFSGLLIIGNLKIIGGQSNISEHILIMGVSLFAISNFMGRLFWGFISDYMGAGLNIFLALTLQAFGIFLFGYFELNDDMYLLLAVLIGFGFGGNFVLFAKETANLYGVMNLATIYPYIFTGYAIAGIAGPLSGGLLFDYYGNYIYAVLLAAMISFSGGLLFLYHHFQTNKKNDPSGR
jgi:MFS transporter, OFA family, oxalate/formate antiporter